MVTVLQNVLNHLFGTYTFTLLNHSMSGIGHTIFQLNIASILLTILVFYFATYFIFLWRYILRVFIDDK